jgi:ubiquinone/menaquinone biosynthesis C-methylase UbiE
MSIVSSDLIKNIVRSNFNRSAELYQQFENKFGLFRFLTLELAEECGITAGMNVLDVGCGTGTSTLILGKLVGKSGRVIGLDISDEMLVIARAEFDKMKVENPGEDYNVEFRNVDSDTLSQFAGNGVNAVLYNASIFLIPDPEITLNATYGLLHKSGVVGMNYLIGIYPKPENQLPENQPDLFQQAKLDSMNFAPYGRRINDVTIFSQLLGSIGFQNIISGTISKKMSVIELRSFYSITAQSAALWPKTEYDERLLLLEECIDYFKECGIKDYYQYWGWITANK